MPPERNGWALPDYAKVGIVGVLCFILLAQMGLIPFVPSPIAKIDAAVSEHHRQTIGPLRLICKGIWKDNPAMVAECER